MYQLDTKQIHWHFWANKHKENIKVC